MSQLPLLQPLANGVGELGTVVKIAPRPSAARPAAQIIRPVQFRNLSGKPGHVPPMNQLLREGRACHRRIQEREKGTRATRKLILIDWLNQAERLWIAAEKHGLKNKHFHVFVAQIGIDRTSAYELLKLHPHRKPILAQCRTDNHWPGWEVCASWFKGDSDDSNDEPEKPTTRNKGILTPTWQRRKVPDDEYGTPQPLFDYYDRIYKFTLDVCSTKKLAKCKRFFTPEQDGLKQTWTGRIWMNPPYGRRQLDGKRQLGEWVRKAYESAQEGAIVVALLPVFTDAQWFHDYASHAAIELLRGRLQFANRDDDGYSPFGHGIFVFRKKSARVGQRLTIGLNGHRIGTSSPAK